MAHSAEGPTLAAINSILSELADVADIHDTFERRTYIDCVFRLLSDTSINWQALKSTRALNYAALLLASKKLRAANAAIQALGDDEKEWISLCLADGSATFKFPLGRRAALEHALRSPFGLPQSERRDQARDWASIIESITIVMSVVAGEAPHAESKGKPGRPKGSKADWLFQDFIARFWQATHILGGELTANCKSNVGTGTMFKALELLKPLLPRGFLRNVPQAQTISNIVKTERAGRGRRAPRSELPSAADRAPWEPSDIVRIEDPGAPTHTKGAPK